MIDGAKNKYQQEVKGEKVKVMFNSAYTKVIYMYVFIIVQWHSLKEQS